MITGQKPQIQTPKPVLFHLFIHSFIQVFTSICWLPITMTALPYALGIQWWVLRVLTDGGKSRHQWNDQKLLWTELKELEVREAGKAVQEETEEGNLDQTKIFQNSMKDWDLNPKTYRRPLNALTYMLGWEGKLVIRFAKWSPDVSP